jgi:hypothetical protein
MTDQDARPDIYISADVETDGPVPGPFSLLSFGLAVVARYDGHKFERVAPREQTFYRELRPISRDYQLDALAVNGLDRDKLLQTGTPPRQAMHDAAEWVNSVSSGHRPVLVAYPVAFDWSFLYWYFERFAASGSPFGHSSCLDIRTLYQAVTGAVFDRSSKAKMPGFLRPDEPHTHNALDDAIEQGELFANLMAWALRRRDYVRHGAVEPGEPSWLAHRVVPIA